MEASIDKHKRARRNGFRESDEAAKFFINIK